MNVTRDFIRSGVYTDKPIRIDTSIYDHMILRPSTPASVSPLSSDDETDSIDGRMLEIHDELNADIGVLTSLEQDFRASMKEINVIFSPSYKSPSRLDDLNVSLSSLDRPQEDQGLIGKLQSSMRSVEDWDPTRPTSLLDAHFSKHKSLQKQSSDATFATAEETCFSEITCPSFEGSGSGHQRSPTTTKGAVELPFEKSPDSSKRLSTPGKSQADKEPTVVAAKKRSKSSGTRKAPKEEVSRGRNESERSSKQRRSSRRHKDSEAGTSKPRDPPGASPPRQRPSAKATKKRSTRSKSKSAEADRNRSKSKSAEADHNRSRSRPKSRTSVRRMDSLGQGTSPKSKSKQSIGSSKELKGSLERLASKTRASRTSSKSSSMTQESNPSRGRSASRGRSLQAGSSHGGLLRRNGRSSSRPREKKSLNIFGNELVSTEFVLNKMNELEDDIEIVKVELEDCLVTTRETLEVPQRLREVLEGEMRPWEGIDFVDEVDGFAYSEFRHNRKVFSRVMGGVCAQHVISVSHKVKVQFNEQHDGDVDSMVHLIRQFQKDHSVTAVNVTTAKASVRLVKALTELLKCDQREWDPEMTLQISNSGPDVDALEKAGGLDRWEKSMDRAMRKLKKAAEARGIKWIPV